MRQQLKQRSYKAGRISQLIRATRPEGTDAGRALQTMEEDEAHVAEGEAVEGEDLEVENIFAEVASEEEWEEWYDAMEEDNSEEVARILQEAVVEGNHGELNQPEILQHHLPRLRGKQEPPGDWQHVPIRPGSKTFWENASQNKFWRPRRMPLRRQVKERKQKQSNDLPVERPGRMRNALDAAQKSLVCFHRRNQECQRRYAQHSNGVASAMTAPWRKPLQCHRKESSSPEHAVHGKTQAERTSPKKFYNMFQSNKQRKYKKLC